MLTSAREGRAGLPGHQHPAASRLARATTTAAPPIRLVAIWLPAVLHAGAVDELRDRLYRLLRHAGSEVVLDGSSVQEISPAAAGVLVAAALLAQQTGSTLRVARPSPVLQHALRPYRDIGLAVAKPGH
jgi:anti-anti-sigma regulatory factor